MYKNFKFCVKVYYSNGDVLSYYMEYIHEVIVFLLQFDDEEFPYQEVFEDDNLVCCYSFEKGFYKP